MKWRWLSFVMAALIGSCVSWQLEAAINRLITKSEVRELFLKAFRVLMIMTVSLVTYAYGFKDLAVLAPIAVVFLATITLMLFAVFFLVHEHEEEDRLDIDMMDEPDFTVTRKRDEHLKRYWSIEDNRKEEIYRVYLRHEPHSMRLDEYSVLLGSEAGEKRIGSLALLSDWGRCDLYDLDITDEGLRFRAKINCFESNRAIEVFVGERRAFELHAKNARKRVYYGYSYMKGGLT